MIYFLGVTFLYFDLDDCFLIVYMLFILIYNIDDVIKLNKRKSMFRSLFSIFTLLSVNTLLANDVNQFSEHLSNHVNNSVITNANLYQSDITVSTQDSFNLEIKSTNTLVNSTVQSGSNIYQNVIDIGNSSITNIVIDSKNSIENSTISNSTITQGSVTIGG